MSCKSAIFVLICPGSNLSPGEETQIMSPGRRGGERKNKSQMDKIDHSKAHGKISTSLNTLECSKKCEHYS